MPGKSSNSVKVFFADKNRVLREVKDYAAKLRRASPEVLKIGLFGSYATGTFSPGSDVDLLIILRKSSKRFLDRIPDYFPENLSVGCDLFPYTAKEIETMKEEKNFWIRHVLHEAIWL